MTLKEKVLYQQIHPLKLGVDIGTSSLTTYFAWQHHIAWFLSLFLIPSIITTMLLIKFAALERLKISFFGKYIEKYMTPVIEAIRFTGQVIIWAAAWFHLPILIVLGILIIMGGWLNGKIVQKARSIKTIE